MSKMSSTWDTLSLPPAAHWPFNQYSKNSPINQLVFQGLPFFYYAVQDIWWGTGLRNRRNRRKWKTIIFWRFCFSSSVELYDRFSKFWNPFIISFILWTTKGKFSSATYVSSTICGRNKQTYSELNQYFQDVTKLNHVQHKKGHGQISEVGAYALRAQGFTEHWESCGTWEAARDLLTTHLQHQAMAVRAYHQHGGS